MMIRIRPKRAMVAIASMGMALVIVGAAFAQTGNTRDQPSEPPAREAQPDSTDRGQAARDRAREREAQARERDAAARDRQIEERDRGQDPDARSTDARRSPGQVTGERPPHPHNGGHPSDPQVRLARRMLHEEALYRNRLARIARLRQLATEQGNEERLRAIDDLEARLHERHEAKVARTREQLGEHFGPVQERLERGRGQRPAHAGQRNREERPGNSTAPQRERTTPPGRGDAGQAAPGRPERTPPDTQRPGGRPDNTGNKSRGGGNR